MIMGVTMIVLNSDSVLYEMSTKSCKFTNQVVALCLSFCWSSHVSSSKYLKGHKSLESLFEHVHYYVCRYLYLCRCLFVDIVLGTLLCCEISDWNGQRDQGVENG